jgi:Tfp pilus assembly protein PilV
MKNRTHAISGFSLVEVTLALGVVVFCLLTVMGLLALGINSTQTSAVQTSATNILTAIASDLQATPNITPATASAKGSVAEISPIYGITLPAAGTATPTAPTTIYIGEDGQVAGSASAALYRLSVWTTVAATSRQETLVRLLITWPAQVAVFDASGHLLANPQGYVENVVAINRT